MKNLNNRQVDKILVDFAPFDLKIHDHKNNKKKMKKEDIMKFTFVPFLVNKYKDYITIKNRLDITINNTNRHRYLICDPTDFKVKIDSACLETYKTKIDLYNLSEKNSTKKTWESRQGSERKAREATR